MTDPGARHLRAEPVTPVCTHHGEGPVWDPERGVVRFVDMLAGAVMGYHPRTGALTRHEVGTVAACLRPRSGGGYVVALERSFALLPGGALDPQADIGPAGCTGAPVDLGHPGDVRQLPPVFADPAVRFNDGGCDPAGRFWMGSMNADGSDGGGSLYRLDPDGSVSTVLAPVGISNGLSFSPDGRTAHYVDTLTARIDLLDVDPARGQIRGRRPFVEIPADQGAPDGIAVDADGGVWVALWGGSAVHRYTSDGTLDTVVEVGARQVSCPAFGGDDLTDLYVTTSREGMEDGEDPLAGALFRVAAGVRGRPVLPFAG